MPEQTLEDHHLKLSIERRAERLIPMVRAAVRGHAPTPSPETVRQYEAAWKRMQARDLAPEEIAPRSRRSYNLYRAALVYRALTILKQAPDYWDEYGQTASAKRAHAFLNLVEQYLNILRHYPPGARDAKSLWRRPPGGP